MTAKTRKEDAESIVGEELAQELEEQAKLVGKSHALIIKSDDCDDTELELQEEAKVVTSEEMDEKERKKEKIGMETENIEDEEKKALGINFDYDKSDIVIEEAVLKKEKDCAHPASHYLVVEDQEKPTTWHLRIKNCDGNLDHHLMGAAWAALHDGYRGNKYDGPEKEKAISKLKSLYKREGLELPSKSGVTMLELLEKIENIGEQINEMKSKYQSSQHEQSLQRHPLANAFDTFIVEFDNVMKSNVDADSKLKMLHEPFTQLGEYIANHIMESVKPTDKQDVKQETSEKDITVQLSQAIVNAMQPVSQKLDLLITQLSANQTSNSLLGQIPQRRSIPANIGMQADIRPQMINYAKNSETPKLRAILERTV